MFGPFFHPNTPKSVWIWLCPHRKHDTMEKPFGLSHCQSEIRLLKVISIIVSWIHDGHSTCSWTCLDPSFINTPQNQPGSGSFHTESMALWRHFLDFPMARLFHGSMMAIQHVAGHVWTLLSSPTPQNQPGSDSVYTESMHYGDTFWTFPWSEWHMIAESHQYHCLMDP